LRIFHQSQFNLALFSYPILRNTPNHCSIWLDLAIPIIKETLLPFGDFLHTSPPFEGAKRVVSPLASAKFIPQGYFFEATLLIK
jgi:hypothetical protein